MPTSRPHFTGYAEMPEGLQNFLFSEQFTKADEELQKTYALTDDQKTLVGDKIMDAVFGDATISKIIADLRAALVPTPVVEAKWKEFIADFLKLEAWPMRELFGDELSSVLNAEQISTAGWPSFRVLLKPLTYGGAASELASMVGFSLMGGQLRERLRDLIMSKMKNVRTDAQVREALTRQSDFGGLGLDAAGADKTIEIMNQLLASVQIMSENEYGDWLAEQSQKSKIESQKSRAAPDARLTTPEDAEIDAIKAKMSAAPSAPATALDAAIESIYQKLSYRPSDATLAKRLRYIISSRLRNVRSDLELRQLLQRDVKVGGLGIAREPAEAIAAQIEEGYKTVHAQIMDEEKKQLEGQLVEQQHKVEERKKRDAEEHATWYREKILARKQEEEKTTKFAEQYRQTLEHPIDLRAERTETEKFGELVPASAAVSTAAPNVKVSRATAEISAPASVGVKSRLEDVKLAGPRLVGPVQELKALTFPEFRRLAKDPEAAAQKILEKINTLGQESFERRVEGIKAWQHSALQQAYMQLVADSFRAAKPVAALAEEKRAKGEDAPSPAELSAVISLNSKLHF